MSIFKCKMCGGSLERLNNETVVTCDYCGTTQTLPRTSDDNIANLFNRANNLRLKCEFDKAAQLYEKIVDQDDSEAEAHWGIVLCKYGIEYVEDPQTNKRIPTCHRTLFEAIATDADYQAAIDYSDTIQQGVYQAEAKAIDRIQKDILAVVKNEEPFDVFICYKETDASGKRTRDSVIANDIYHQLTTEGYKVFYAAITLEDKLGQEYEPYIFAALNSAKVMLVVGTQPEYFSAVWVKNEWSRFLQLMKSDRSKLLIPCYRDMDPYDLPEEFSYLQAQDMGKIGFINDLVRGIQKVIKKDEPKPQKNEKIEVKPENISQSAGNAKITSYLKRAYIFLEDGDWKSADEYCEKILDIDPENAEAYLCKMMAELKVRSKEELASTHSLESNKNYQKALRFADSKIANELNKYVEYSKEWRRRNEIYKSAVSAMNRATTESEYLELFEEFNSISGFRDADAKAKECLKISKEAKEAAIIAERYRMTQLEEIKVREYIDKQNSKSRTTVTLFFILGYVAVAFLSLQLPAIFKLEFMDGATGLGIAIFLLSLPTLLTFISLTKPDKGGMVLALISNLLCIPIVLLFGLGLMASTDDLQTLVEMAPTALLALHIAIISTWRRRIGKRILRITQNKK